LGGPGVGKSWLIQQLIFFLKQANVTVSCSAYTGSAASNIPGALTSLTVHDAFLH
jgi:F0F1-type ATP synthase beta subunit